MKKVINIFLWVFLLAFIGCSSDESVADDVASEADMKTLSGESAFEKAAASGGQGGQQGGEPGVVTAGEWNDLDNWDFWNKLFQTKEFSGKQEYWSFYPQNRVSVQVQDTYGVVVNAKVELFYKNKLKWTARTDNMGKAELWVALYQKDNSVAAKDCYLKVNGAKVNSKVKFYKDGINKVQLYTKTSPAFNRVELSFIVDATGSMGDELEFLKQDLKDVIKKVQSENSTLDINTSSVFYRDEGDEYVVRKSGFSADLKTTLAFINEQRANGGGDYPEAVHTALKTALEELQWSEKAKTRIAFLLLDAPPHYKKSIVADLQESIKMAAEKGIKIIPITASGIDKETEFLMRFFAISTNGTYVFITNHSGVGNSHIEASVGEYQVEKLNALLVRLIKKYTE